METSRVEIHHFVATKFRLKSATNMHQFSKENYFDTKLRIDRYEIAHRLHQTGDITIHRMSDGSQVACVQPD